MQLYTFEGSPQAAGRAHGETFRTRIQELAEIRIELTLGRTDFRGRSELLAMAERHVQVLAQADQALHDEFMGIAAGAGRAVIFRKGEKVRVVPEAEMLTALMEEVENTPVPASD